MVNAIDWDIPIVAYPPFKLRSSLIDKDPVIWVHLIEFYIRLFRRLITLSSASEAKLPLKSQQQLTIFLKVYLEETAEESSRIFSLGSINPDILKNSKIFKLYVFEFIKVANLTDLNLGGDSVWNFVKIYAKLAELNSNRSHFPVTLTAVRDILQGVSKSKSRSSDISLVNALQSHIKAIIEAGKFAKNDIQTLSLLLGRHIQTTERYNSKTIANNRSKSNRSAAANRSDHSIFAEKFVNVKWIETLEVLYNKGSAVHSKTAFEVAVVSILSLSVAKLSRLISAELNISSFKTLLRLYPLLSSIILSEGYAKLNPGLKERIPFLSKEGRKQASALEFNVDQINMVLDLFPQLTQAQVKKLLLEHNHNVESVTHYLLEADPSEIASLKEYREFKRSVYDDDDFSNLKFTKSNVYYGKKDRANEKFNETRYKEKTLSAALRLLYESDEDEPDDTYVDQELTTGARLKLEDSTRDDVPLNVSKDSKLDSKIEEIETFLFTVYKRSPELLERKSRKDKARAALKEQTKWSDEQIEGWARMLVKQPSKFRMLDEKYTFGIPSDNHRNMKASTSYIKPKPVFNGTADDAEDGSMIAKERQSVNESVQSTSSNLEDKTNGKKTDRNKKAYDSRKKASRANHNRKAGHDKKMSKGMV